MKIFNRRRNEPIIEPKCQHKYQDFPWYLEWSSSEVKVIEPYVCIYCGERKNKILCHYTNVTSPLEVIEQLHKQFDNHIKYKEEVEDMVNDMVLVDPEYLKYYHMLRAQNDPTTSRSKDTKIKLQL